MGVQLCLKRSSTEPGGRGMAPCLPFHKDRDWLPPGALPGTRGKFWSFSRPMWPGVVAGGRFRVKWAIVW